MKTFQFGNLPSTYNNYFGHRTFTSFKIENKIINEHL